MKKSELRQIIKEEIANVLKEETDFDTTANILGAVQDGWIKEMKTVKKNQKALIIKQLDKYKLKGQDKNDTIADVVENFFDLWQNELEEDAQQAALGGYQ